VHRLERLGGLLNFYHRNAPDRYSILFRDRTGCGSELDAQGNLVNRVQGTVTSGGGRGSIDFLVTN
jgi:hypothetical protein